METVKQQTASNATSEQGTSAAPQRKGGFIQGAAVAQGCCGETSTGSGGCCGAPAQAVAPAGTIQSSAQAGCCGTTAPKTEAITVAAGCCS
jgi:hypothetical protein